MRDAQNRLNWVNASAAPDVTPLLPQSRIPHAMPPVSLRLQLPSRKRPRFGSSCDACTYMRGGKWGVGWVSMQVTLVLYRKGELRLYFIFCFFFRSLRFACCCVIFLLG